MAQCACQGKESPHSTMFDLPSEVERSTGQDSSGASLFLSAESALDWAYGVAARPIVKLSMINNMRMNGGYHGSTNTLIMDLTAQDRHGQAALIIGLIDRVRDPVGREYIKARFGRKTDPADLLCLVDYCASGLRMEGKKEGVYMVLKDFFGGRMSIRTVRREIGCRHHSAAVVRHRLFTALDMVELRAMNELRGVLEERGLVQPSRSA